MHSSQTAASSNTRVSNKDLQGKQHKREEARVDSDEEEEEKKEKGRLRATRKDGRESKERNGKRLRKK